MKLRALSIVSAIALLGALFLSSCASRELDDELARIFDHADADVEGLSDARLASARDKLRIAYWHTSHGSQLVDGMGGMDAFYGGTGRFALGEWWDCGSAHSQPLNANQKAKAAWQLWCALAESM